MPEPSAPTVTANRTYRPGTIIAGKYRLERVLGEGGQGCVWEARNLALDVCVAIKFVALSAENGAQSARLLVEARAAAQLRHPGIVHVFDFGQLPNGDSFLVMELLEGESLARSLARVGRFSPEQALRLLLPIAEAVGSAHARGIVHRDIKPENIFIAKFEEQTQPKLLDFGIAKVGDAAPADHLTRAGTIVGSPAYLSPEQARGEADIDHRADVWAFAATLYQCITGQLPFWRDSYNALLWSIVEDEPKPTFDFGVGDGALWEIIKRGLSKSKEDRWESIQVFGRALAAWLCGRGVRDDVSAVPLQGRWLKVEFADAVAHASPAPVALQHEVHASPSELAHPPISRSVNLSHTLQKRRPALGFVAAIAVGLLGGALFWLAPQVQGAASAAQNIELPKAVPAHAVVLAPRTAPSVTVAPLVTPVPHSAEAARAPQAAQPVAAASPRNAAAPVAAPAERVASVSANEQRVNGDDTARSKGPTTVAVTPRKRWRGNPEAELMNPY